MAGTFSGVIFKKAGQDVDATVLRGKTLDFTILLTASGQPMNMTGWQVRLVSRNSSGLRTLELTTSNGGATLIPNQGRIRFQATPDQTARVDPGIYEIEIEKPNGEVHRLMSGRMMISGDIA